MKSSIDRNRKLVYLDEIIFTKSTNFRLAWSLRKRNVQLPCEVMSEKYTAVIAAISKGCGFELVKLYDKAANEDIFAKYLYKLQAVNKH